MRKTFWMVLGCGTPVYRHKTRMSARTEAERLARECPGQEFWVLESMDVVKKTDLMWEECHEDAMDDSIPF